jgi:hypothetical protein
VSLKNSIAEALKSGDHEGIFRLWSSDNRALRVLLAMTYDRESVDAWLAIEAVGILTGKIAQTDPELVRNITGRLLWMIRDESGGIGWSVPDMLGAMVRNSPDLLSDIAPIIISFHEEKMLLPGVLRAIGRIGEVRADLVSDGLAVLSACLESPDPYLCGISLWSVGKLNAEDLKKPAGSLCSDGRRFSLYENGELSETTVGETARKVLSC